MAFDDNLHHNGNNRNLWKHTCLPRNSQVIILLCKMAPQKNINFEHKDKETEQIAHLVDTFQIGKGSDKKTSVMF